MSGAILSTPGEWVPRERADFVVDLRRPDELGRLWRRLLSAGRVGPTSVGQSRAMLIEAR